MKKGKLIIFSAPSGSGKTTIVHHLLAQKELNLEFSISAASREKRGKEVDKKDYYFISAKTFKKLIKKEKFVEYEEVYKNNFYGTLKKEVKRIRKAGKNVIFDIDVIGGLNIKKQFKKKALAVFVQPPSIEEMERRLRHRKTDSEEKIIERLAKAKKEFLYAKEFDIILLNDNLEQAKKDAYKLVKTFIN
jgi:guanylate kinase